MNKIRFYFTALALLCVLNSFSKDETRIYKKVNDSIGLKLRLIQPTNVETGFVPCVIFLSGGGWQDFVWNQLDELAYALADRGMLSVVVEYRTSKKHNSTPYNALEDVKDVLTYLRNDFETLCIDKDKMIAVGVSAGAHLAFSSFFVDKIGNKNYDKNSKPNYIIGLSPVIRNDNKGYAYNRIGKNYKWFSPYYNYMNTDSHLPPSMIISGEDDPLIEFEYLEEFYKKAVEKGDDLLLYSVKNVAHSMKRTYKSIYMQSFPIIISFLEDNDIIKDSEIIKPIKFENNTLRKTLIFTLLVIVLISGYFFKKSKTQNNN